MKVHEKYQEEHTNISMYIKVNLSTHKYINLHKKIKKYMKNTSKEMKIPEST